MILIGELCISM